MPTRQSQKKFLYVLALLCFSVPVFVIARELGNAEPTLESVATIAALIFQALVLLIFCVANRDLIRKLVVHKDLRAGRQLLWRRRSKSALDT